MPPVRSIIVGTLVCVAGVSLIAVCVCRHAETTGGAKGTLGSKGIGAVAAGLSGASQKRIEVSTAQLGDGSADTPAEDEPAPRQLAIAQIGSLDSTFGGPAAGAARGVQPEADQSDAELGSTFAEPTHTVAPVPVQDESQAAVNVALAAIHARAPVKPAPLATVRAPGRPSAVRIALVVYPGRPGAAGRIGDLRDQVRVANSQQAVFVASASFAVPSDPGGANIAADSIPRGWPLEDESPIADPSFLIGRLSPGDPLRSIARHWEADASSGPADSPALVSSDVDRAIAGSAAAWQLLYEMGRDSAFFDASSSQKAFWYAAVARAGASSNNSILSRYDLRSMQVLAATSLWTWKDDASASRALRTLLKWEKHNSRSAGQAALLLTTILDRQGRQDAAAP